MVLERKGKHCRLSPLSLKKKLVTGLVQNVQEVKTMAGRKPWKPKEENIKLENYQ